MAIFDIRIIDQYWLESLNAEQDLSSHGTIYLEAVETVITSPEVDDFDWGISESALAMLRTLKYGHPVQEHDYGPLGFYEDYLIYHGCGGILMMGCPIHISWNVRHENGDVILSNFEKCTVTNESACVHYDMADIRLPIQTYRNIILAFAMQAKELFTMPKIFSDDFERDMYAAFWKEYEALLEYAQYLK